MFKKPRYQQRQHDACLHPMWHCWEPHQQASTLLVAPGSCAPWPPPKPTPWGEGGLSKGQEDLQVACEKFPEIFICKAMVLGDPMSECLRFAPPGQRSVGSESLPSSSLFRLSVTSETLSPWHHKSNNIAGKDVKRGRPFLKPWNERVAVA